MPVCPCGRVLHSRSEKTFSQYQSPCRSVCHLRRQAGRTQSCASDLYSLTLFSLYPPLCRDHFKLWRCSTGYHSQRQHGGQLSTMHPSQACQPIQSKNLEIGWSDGCGPMNSLASHTHRRKIDDIESEIVWTLAWWIDIYAWCYQPSLTQLAYIWFSPLNMQPSSVVSKIRRHFPTPDRIFRSWR